MVNRLAKGISPTLRISDYMNKASDLKRIARERLFTRLGTLAGATAIYGIIYGAIGLAILIAFSLNLFTKGVFASIATMEDYATKMSSSLVFFLELEGTMIVVGAIMSTVSVAIMYMALKTARGQEIKLSDILYVVKNNPDKVIIIYAIQSVLLFLVSAPHNVISVYTVGVESAAIDAIYYAFMIFSYIADIYITVMFSQAMFVFIENPQENAIKCLEMSQRVMTKNFGRYFMLELSFLPLIILASLSFGILYLWVIPYQYTTYALFYMQLKGELGSTIDVTIQ